MIEDVYGVAGPAAAALACAGLSVHRPLVGIEMHYAGYVAAGTVTREGVGAMGSQRGERVPPDDARRGGTSAHSVKLQEREEAAEAAAEKERGIVTKEKVKLRDERRQPMGRGGESGAERRAEMSLAADDGYGECYAGGFAGYGANAYESDDTRRRAKEKRGGRRRRWLSLLLP